MIKPFKNSCFQPKLLIKPMQKIAISYKTFALLPYHVFNSTELPLPVKMAQSISNKIIKSCSKRGKTVIFFPHDK